ncbi:hypothetical protein BKA93DRAFT_505796 [Sparassis latifolia]
MPQIGGSSHPISPASSHPSDVVARLVQIVPGMTATTKSFDNHDKSLRVSAASKNPTLTISAAFSNESRDHVASRLRTQRNILDSWHDARFQCPLSSVSRMLQPFRTQYVEVGTSLMTPYSLGSPRKGCGNIALNPEADNRVACLRLLSKWLYFYGSKYVFFCVDKDMHTSLIVAQSDCRCTVAVEMENLPVN